jgi:hypothetical protein
VHHPAGFLVLVTTAAMRFSETFLISVALLQSGGARTPLDSFRFYASGTDFAMVAVCSLDVSSAPAATTRPFRPSVRAPSVGDHVWTLTTESGVHRGCCPALYRLSATMAA